jgi:hypothetical protein
MADERRRCHCRDDEESGRKREEREECTDATLAIALVDAEHRNVSPEITFAMGRLLADYDSDGMGFTLSICLWEESSGSIASRKICGIRLVQGRRGEAYKQRKDGVSIRRGEAG